MQKEKYLIDELFDRFKKSLPKLLRPHSNKILFIFAAAGILGFFGWAYGVVPLLALLASTAILWGVIALWMFLKWLFTGKAE